MGKRGPLPKLSIEQVAEIMEKMESNPDVCWEVLAMDYDITPSQLARTIKNAERLGYQNWHKRTLNHVNG